MEEKVIEIEADSLEEARRRLQAEIPDGYDLVSEDVISHGKSGTVGKSASTVEEAYAQAEASLPAGARVQDKKVLAAPAASSMSVDAFDRQEACSIVDGKLVAPMVMKDIRVVAAGSSGFLGIGKKPTQYEAVIFQPATVELTYSIPARVSGKAVLFLKPLKQTDKPRISNLAPVLYETVIKRKREGTKLDIVYGDDMEVPGLLEQLEIQDLEILAQSVRVSMEADGLHGSTAAAELYKQAFELNPYNDVALMSYGRCLARQGSLREGIKWVEKAVEINPGNDRARSNLRAMKADL